MKRFLRRAVYSIPGTQDLWVRFNRALGLEDAPSFSGWGMTTYALPPWHGGGDELTADFLRVNSEVIARVTAGQFSLSQFEGVQDKTKRLQQLMWRHYIVFWSARYASQVTRPAARSLVECGVCDGLTAYFAMSAVAGPFTAFLYDAWQGMKAEYLLESEKIAEGNYSYLSLDATKRNLERFERHTTFVKGFIPESFHTAAMPTEVAWLHVDLNSSIATVAALEMLFDRVSSGGVILFDDYGWPGYQDTKARIDEFFRTRPGWLLALPTSQAMFFKR